MGTFTERVQERGGGLLWLDAVDYATRLLAAGRAPWLDAAECAAWQRKTQGLLGSDVAFLPIAQVVAAWLERQPALAEAMRARSRAVYPLKTLLADEPLRAHLVDLLHALRGSVRASACALTCPSPRAWVALAYEQAHGGAVEVDDDATDTASMYVADFLRAFGDAGVDALLLTETAASEPADDAALVCYQSVLNVAHHYRWDVGLALPSGRDGTPVTGLDFVVTPAAGTAAVPTGRVVPAEFWSGAPPPAPLDRTFRYATVPGDASPEQVLERLALLR